MGIVVGLRSVIPQGFPVPIDTTTASRQQATASAKLGALVFRCPARRRSIGTGIETDARTFLRIRHLKAQVYCPTCGQLHEFKVASGSFAPLGSSLQNKESIQIDGPRQGADRGASGCP